LEPDIDACQRLQFLREPRPRLCGGERPHAIGGLALALRLHPHEPEVAARRAVRDIALVEHCDAFDATGKAVGDRGADEAAADYGDIEFTVVVARLHSWMRA